MVSRTEISRRFANIRTAMEAENIDALVVCGNEYSGFEGAIRYVSGFEIVHRYVYALIPLQGESKLVFPREARWIGDKKKPWIQDHVWADVPGEWLSRHFQKQGWRRIAVYGLAHVMAVCDYQALSKGGFELIPFDFAFDMARAVKSEEELAGVRNSMEVIERGFWALLKAYRPGRTEAQIMAPAVEEFFAGGAGPRMMNIVLSGTGGEAEAHFKVPSDRVVQPDDLLLYSLEVTAFEGYWVEFSRPLIQGSVSPRTAQMIEVYPEALEAARRLMHDGIPASEIHRAATQVFARKGFKLGHLSGHSIGLTMIEHPAIGADVDIELKENMVFSFHPQVVDENGEVCVYTQDTFRIGRNEGENLSRIPWKIYRGEESIATVE